ncbi:MAG: hypothetical protein A2329_01175 [Sulfurimonas sp. RIFOXYB2_FULL_37_5]|jgi:hypothetical protein|nr:hypothetical protein [Sulfurimonas sp.]OHE12398.1 MAG: hypothetical protein A2329_01175 [Sulfurimonas sp. RIFOXYB2_FULL_37_5]
MEIEEKKGWSWLGFLFAPFYYAGYGDMKKGLIFALISGFPLFAIFICIYGGLKAKKELPIGEVDFKWSNAVIAFVVTFITYVVLKTVITSLKG